MPSTRAIISLFVFIASLLNMSIQAAVGENGDASSSVSMSAPRSTLAITKKVGQSPTTPQHMHGLNIYDSSDKDARQYRADSSAAKTKGKPSCPTGRKGQEEPKKDIYRPRHGRHFE
ncbi:uncharacterized protein FA14DRAFT_157201 [Meira miltonrushii]|uniref:Uncharacterized protein n=1 Tax=Meira miltonrushii TaxID=1280837 RepID=A0A316V5I0_9BASI|nr:uncharacterized protein FA14DRAFT_157201 [Meira miltonrushii]PWN32484.1 hypothetical protein FA14DRAFT_157201 [Meira miltonrushii]